MGAVLAWAFVVVIAGVLFMGWACWHRAHDGTMTGRAELAEDIREDTGTGTSWS